MINFLSDLKTRFQTFRLQNAVEFLEEVDLWVKDLSASKVNFEELDKLYQRAIQIRLRDDPKNRYPMGIYEILVANQELKIETQELLRRQKIESNHGKCQFCNWAKEAEVECRVHGRNYQLAD